MATALTAAGQALRLTREGNQVKRNVEWVANTNELPLQRLQTGRERSKKMRGNQVGRTDSVQNEKVQEIVCRHTDMAAAYGSITQTHIDSERVREKSN